MRILVINPGSSSIKFSVFVADSTGAGGVRSEVEGELSGIATDKAALVLRSSSGQDLSDGAAPVGAATMEQAMASVERALDRSGIAATDAVGYRVVHPGPRMNAHQRITPEVLQRLRDARSFAPLHDPIAVEIIEEMMRRMPGVHHFACFDTVFHETMPEQAKVYALPEPVRCEGVRRYGFHGLSCESVVWEMREGLGRDVPQRLVIAHLGSGCSVTACEDGHSVDTTMGLTPTGGVLMGTRPGDLDPGLVLYLLRRPGASAASVEQMLNHDAGLKALGGVNDMRELRTRAAAGDAAAGLAIAVFTTSVARAIAGMVVLHGADALAFTGGIGEHDVEGRREIAGHLGVLGFLLDAEANSRPGDSAAIRSIGARVSSGPGKHVYVARADEDRMIALHVLRLCAQVRDRSAGQP